MSENNQDIKKEGFAARVKKAVTGCGGNCGCCCGDSKIVPTEDAESEKKN